MRKLIILLIFLLACLGASAQNIGNYVNDRPAATSSEIDSSLVLIISRQTPVNKSKKMRLDSLAKKLGGGSGSLREVTLTLTDAQIKATNTTPINLIPSSEVASNQVVVIYHLYAELTGTTAYNESAFLTARVIGTTGSGQALTFLDVDGTLPNFANRQDFGFISGLVDPKGVGVEISNNSPADLTGGNAANQVKIVVQYSLVTIP